MYESTLRVKKGAYHKDSSRLDYIILMPISSKSFSSNGIDLSRENELLLKNSWYDDVILTFDDWTDYFI